MSASQSARRQYEREQIFGQPVIAENEYRRLYNRLSELTTSEDVVWIIFKEPRKHDDVLPYLRRQVELLEAKALQEGDDSPMNVGASERAAYLP